MPESLGCQIGVTTEAGSHLHPRYKQMKDVRPFEGIRGEEFSDGVRDQTRLSILSWNAGFQRGKITNSLVGSYHVIILQETRSNSTSFRVDQVIMFHKNTFELGGVKAEGEIPGTSKQDSSCLKCTPASVHLGTTTAKRRGIAKQLLGQIRDFTA